MATERLLLVGLEEPEYLEIKARVKLPVLFWPDLPRCKLEGGRLLAEHPEAPQLYVPVSHVIFHGIFEDDFDLITALALWRGPCLPSARGLLDCRLRLPCLARTLLVTRFGSMLRGFAPAGVPVKGGEDAVAKWGNWHCGENKERFSGERIGEETAVIEPFIRGEAVRVVLIGPRFWQVRLAGEGWLKSIHHGGARLMEVDERLLEDTRQIAAHFGLEMVGVDYMVAEDGTPHLLEVNHIPNVTVFPEMRSAFLDMAADWVAGSR